MNEKEYLQSYDDTKYAKPSVTADISIFTISDDNGGSSRKLMPKKLRILMIKRGRHPYMGMYALPGGFVRPNETLEQAAVRELKEETGVECGFLKQVRVFSGINRDPRRWVISCSFMALLDGRKFNVSGGDDAESAEWFDITFKEVYTAQEEIMWELALENRSVSLTATIKQAHFDSLRFEYPDFEIVKSDGIAFDHALIIAHSLFTLRRLIRVSDIAFELLPEQFTLSELQKIYETVLDKELLTPAFRRSVAGLVEETGQFETNVKHRPSKLFKKR